MVEKKSVVTFVLDCCFAGAMTRSARRVRSTTVGIARNLASIDLSELASDEPGVSHDEIRSLPGLHATRSE
jgi:hypothetical protein